jgi:hypothetical protein
VDPDPDTSTRGPHEDGERTTQEQARAFVEQLRATPAEQIISEVLSTLLTAAEVKLGRRDARLFIDLCAAVTDHTGQYLSDELGKQVGNVLGQLRLGQVSAERQTVRDAESEPNDLARAPSPPPAGTGEEAQAGGPSTPSPASRLWVPGR